MLCVCFAHCYSQLKTKVDERFELTGVVARIAGYEEYINNEVEPYINEIDKYFAKFQNHAMINFAKKIREENEIGFDAISGISAILEIKNGKVQLIQDADLDEFIRKDYRWNKESIATFVSNLNKFYKDTKFGSFYLKHRNFYSKYEERFDDFINGFLHPQWFEDFYGQPFGNPQIAMSLLNGRSNYAFLEHITNQPKKKGIVIGVAHTDSTFLPIFDLLTQNVVIHELSHTFTNPIVDKYKEQMEEAIDTIFPYIETRLAKYNYGKASILYECFTSLFTDMYIQDNSYSAYYPFYKRQRTYYAVSSDVRMGWVWNYRALSFMDNFLNNRQLYPTIKEFFPQLVAFFNWQSKDMPRIMEEVKNFTPYPVNIFPQPNTKVPADIKEIKIEFSRPMHVGVKTLGNKIDGLIRPVEKLDSISWSQDGKSYIMKVNLEKNKRYGIKIPTFLQSQEGVPLKNDIEIIFETE